MLGGPNHGKRYGVPGVSDYYNFVELPYRIMATEDFLKGTGYPSIKAATMDTESRKIVEIQLGTHKVGAVRAAARTATTFAAVARLAGLSRPMRDVVWLRSR